MHDCMGSIYMGVASVSSVHLIIRMAGSMFLTGHTRIILNSVLRVSCTIVHVPTTHTHAASAVSILVCMRQMHVGHVFAIACNCMASAAGIVPCECMQFNLPLLLKPYN